MASIRDDPGQPGLVRSAAADRLLQWAYGPPRPAEHDAAPLADLSDAALDELADEEEQQQDEQDEA